MPCGGTAPQWSRPPRAAFTGGKAMRRAFVLAAAAALAACGGGGGGGATSVHAYHAAAPVGDFLTLTIDASAHTIAYVNVTNGDAGTVSYTDRSDGGMDVTDPHGDLVLCYQLPGKAVVCRGDTLGPTAATREPALLFGVLDAPLVKDDLRGLGGVGYMQFRTKEGGMEVGHFTLDADGNAAGNAWFPMNQVFPTPPPQCYGKSEYNELSISFADFADDPTYGCVERTESTPDGPKVSRVFGTPSGDYMVDAPGGALFIWRDAASTAFDPANAGSYSALVYGKHVSYQSGVETGTPEIVTAAVQIGATGTITVTQGTDAVFDAVELLPFAGSPWQGATRVTDPTPGLFYFMDGADPVFVTFFQDALAFATFHPDAVAATCSDVAEYSYTYGIAVKAP
jgi:hypothetical protein